jgi:type IV pilus assembly protein PilE
MTISDRPARDHGFTLIELMIAMVVLALLLSISIPTYKNQIRKSRRTEAKTALLDIVGREERLYSVTNAYSATPSDLGYAATGVAWSAVTIGNGYYQISIPVQTATTFTVTATAITTDQLKDTACRSFTIVQTGVQTALDSSGADNTATCWR